MSLKSEVPLLALRESPALFFLGQFYQTCAYHEGVATELFTTRRVSRSFPSLSSDGGPCARFAFQRIAPTLAETNNFQLRAPLPWLAPDLQVHRSDTSYMMPSSVFTDTSTTLRVRFQDRWSTSHYRTGQRIVIVCCPSFPGTRCKTWDRRDRSARRLSRGRTFCLFVLSGNVAAGPTFFGFAAARNLP